MNQRNKEQHNIRQNLPTAEKVNLFLISIFVIELQGFFFFFDKRAPRLDPKI